MSIFSIETIKASRGKSLYKSKNTVKRVAQESTYVYNEIDTDSTDFLGTVDDILKQIKSLQSSQENILNNAKLKVNNRDIIDLESKAKAVIPYVEQMPDDISIEIPNARIYHNIESRPIGFHHIFMELKKEISSINELLLILKNLSKGYKVPESEIIIKKMLEDRPNYKEFNVDFINYFSSPVDKIDKSIMMEYIKDFFYMTDNYYNLVKNSFEFTCHSLNGIYDSLSTFKCDFNIDDKIFDNPELRELLKNKLEYISNMYINAIKYLYTYQISIEQRFDTDITAIRMLYDSMTGKINANSIEDNTLDDDIEYGRFLGETAIINEAGEEKKISTYLVKITNGIRIAWNKLNQKLNDGRKKLMDKFKDKLDEIDANFDKVDPDFTITNYPNYDFTKLDNIKVLPLNYEDMKDSLKSENDFIKKYYSQIPHNDKANFKEDITNYVMTSRQDLKVSAETLHGMMKFVREDYDNHRKSVQTDIETMNKSNENITTIAKNLKNQEQSNQNSIKVDTSDNSATPATPAAATNVNAKSESAILTEADEKAPKVEIKDDPNRKAPAGDQSFTKDISVYMKVSSAVMSSKMKILKDHFMLSVNCIIHAATPPKKSEEEKKEEKANKEEKK